jgi:small subunit ribosomal protein S3
MRLGITKTWSSRWYAGRDYADLIKQDLIIREYFHKKFSHASLAKIDIERAARQLKINVYSGRPGVLIGKKGAGADALKAEIMKLCKLQAQDVVVNILEVKRPDVDAQLVADGIRQQLEKRVSFRRAMKKAIASTMKAGAKGIKVQCSGRLGGADMSRVERYREGRVPLHTLRADIDYATAEALTTYGLTGIKVWIFHGEILGKNPLPA